MPEEIKQQTESILLTIKKMLGITEEHHAFDVDIIVDINACFLTLNQLGVGPKLPYSISGDSETWIDFLGEQNPFFAAIQTYVYMRVRLMFDPPANSFLVDSMQKQIQEFEWRFTVQPKNDEEVAYVDSFKEKYVSDTTEDTPDQNESSDKKSDDNITAFSIKGKNLYDIFS